MTIHQEANLILSSRDLARGARYANYDELGLLPVPASTETWHPVPYQTLVTLAKEVLGNTLPGDYELIDEGYVLAQSGNQLFGALTYKSTQLNLPFAAGLRGSYNQTLSEAICLGGRVTVCSNLMFSGLLRVVRKSTKNVIANLQDMLYDAARQATGQHIQMVGDVEKLYRASLTDRRAFEIMGRAYGAGLVGERQLPVVKKEWLTPSFADFSGRNQWSLYNAFTHALKTTHPSEVMNRLVDLHNFFME
ncbi:MAG: hypothetical protein L6R45_10015 [Anaerolineae bacterium]|nr:hypothetical protein [Anaerolineae bacterium]